jgi:hypothetical protein
MNSIPATEEQVTALVAEVPFVMFYSLNLETSVINANLFQAHGIPAPVGLVSRSRSRLALADFTAQFVDSAAASVVTQLHFLTRAHASGEWAESQLALTPVNCLVSLPGGVFASIVFFDTRLWISEVIGFVFGFALRADPADGTVDSDLFTAYLEPLAESPATQLFSP